jgi:plasmid stabilization system protein ParE
MAQIDWLATLSPSAALDAERAIRTQLKTLEAFPTAGRAINAVERKWPIPFGRDGFVAVYRIETDRVVIARLFHSRQDR